jgi:hypothetical protein
MITVSEKLVDSGPPLGSIKRLPREVRKVVVIQVKRRFGSEYSAYERNGAYGENDVSDLDRNMGQVLGNKIMDLKHGRVVFWFLKRMAGKNLGFESSFLRGAAAAIVLLELSDRETIHMTKELMRDICKLFSIPVMMVVGGTMGEEFNGQAEPTRLGEIASRVVGFTDDVSKTAVPAS